MKINGDKLSIERKLKGITQEMLAEGVELSQAMISMLEQSTRNVSWSTIDVIANFIGCDPTKISENGEPSPYTQVIRDFKKLTERKQELVIDLIKEFLK